MPTAVSQGAEQRLFKSSKLAVADDVAAYVAAGGRGYASAVDHVHTRAAGLANLRDHVIGLSKRRK
jgi:hypothetical protein